MIALTKLAHRLPVTLLLATTSFTAPAGADPMLRLDLRFERAAASALTPAFSRQLMTPTPQLVSPSDARLAALMAQRPSLEYTPRDSSLTLALEPGSPCTGACFKLVGWF